MSCCYKSVFFDFFQNHLLFIGDLYGDPFRDLFRDFLFLSGQFQIFLALPECHIKVILIELYFWNGGVLFFTDFSYPFKPGSHLFTEVQFGKYISNEVVSSKYCFAENKMRRFLLVVFNSDPVGKESENVVVSVLKDDVDARVVLEQGNGINRPRYESLRLSGKKQQACIVKVKPPLLFFGYT